MNQFESWSARELAGAKNQGYPWPLTTEPPLSHNQDKLWGEVPMTIIIGALCDKRQSVLMLSDKMGVSLGGLTFEATKSCSLTNHSLVLISGLSSNAIFLEEVKKNVQPNAPTINLADFVSRFYSAFRNARFTAEVLMPQGFTDFNDFHTKQKQLDGVLIGSIVEQARTYDSRMGIELILGGFDNLGGHIFHIQNNGMPVSYDSMGFYCAPTFSAGIRASAIFESLGFSPDLLPPQALAIAFSAKKRSEGLGGIGKETDAWKIDKDGVHKISKETIEELENKYEKIKKELSWVKELETEIKIEGAAPTAKPQADNLTKSDSSQTSSITPASIAGVALNV